MTRVARASGSKGANEKKPEEATSWADMKASMVRPKSTKDATPAVESVADADIPSAQEIQSVWADLTSEFNISVKKKAKKKLKLKQQKTIDSAKLSTKSIAPVSSAQVPDVDPNHTNDSELAKMSNENKLKHQKKVKNKKIIDKSNAPVSSAEASAESPLMSNKSSSKRKRSESIDLDHHQTKKPNIDRPTVKDKRNKQKESAPHPNKIFGSNKKTTKNAKTGEKASKNVDHNHQSTAVSPAPKEHKRRKEPLSSSEIIINGRKVKLAPFDGFMVQADDAVRLRQLRQDMKKKGIPDVERERAIKLERRRAEKALARVRKNVCYHCRGAGHNLSDCPHVTDGQQSSGICYKCGSTEHTHFQCKVNRGNDYPFAECFICKEQGHIARNCPDNPRGLYPRGGGCAVCLDVTHLKKDCPKYLAEKVEDKVTIGMRNDLALEALDDENQFRKVPPPSFGKKLNKHVKF